MKKGFLLLIGLCCAISSRADLREDFNSLTSGSWSSETEVELPSGVWTFGGGAQRNSSNNVVSIKFNTNGAYLITPAVDSVTSVQFMYRSGGSTKKIAIAYQIGADDWTALDTLNISSSSSSFSSYSKNLDIEPQANVRIRLIGITNNVYVDDMVLKHATASTGGSTGEVIPAEPDTTFTRPTFVATGNTYYISPAGNDETGDGSFENPWFNIGKAVSVAQAGDVIYCRGGRYMLSWRGTDGKLTVRLSQSGTATAPIVISSYENEVPIFDWEQQLLDCNRNKALVGDRGMLITGDHWILFGLHLTHAADNAIKLEGSYNRIERCEFSYNLDTGIQLGFGHNFSDSGYGSSNDGTHCAYNDIVDCDSHHNCDFDSNYGSDADGFACKMHNGRGNRFIRCRSWRNSDDAWDLYETDYDVVLIECWAWESGKASDHLWPRDYLDGNASFSGNGNGIKLGGNGTGGSSKGIHYAYRCVAFGCNITGSVKGFDCNSHKGGHVLINCLAFDNGYDYMFESGGSDANSYYCNNVCFGRQEICVGTDDHNAITSPMSKNGWSNNLVTGISRSEYQSLDEADAIMPRRGDGSLPTRFARLMPDSRLVDAGTYPDPSRIPNLAQLEQDYPFLVQAIYGSAPDMGPYELPVGETNPTAVQAVVSPNSQGAIALLQGNYDGEMIIRYSVPADAPVVLTMYDLSGRVLQTVHAGMATNGVDYYQPVQTNGMNGVCIVRLQAGNFSTQAKAIIR